MFLFCNMFTMYISIESLDKLPGLMLSCAIWLSAAVICATRLHCIHLVSVQPPGVKVGWPGHAALQHRIPTSLTLAYVGYTAMFQQSPLTALFLICHSPSLHLPPSHLQCLRSAAYVWPLVPASSSSEDSFSSSVSFSISQEGLFLALPYVSIIMTVSAWMSTCCGLWWTSLAGLTISRAAVLLVMQQLGCHFLRVSIVTGMLLCG